MSYWKGCCLLIGALLLGGSSMAIEITFQATEVDLGQDVNTITPIDGDEWLTFGIDMNGDALLVYGPPNPDPFPPATDNNGVFEAAAGSFEIVFNDPVTNLEVDWFSPSLAESTLVAYNPSGIAVQVEVNPGGSGQETELFPGTIIKRLVIESAPGTLCLANLRFELVTGIPAVTTWGMAGTFALLLGMLTAVRIRRGRRAQEA